MVLGGLFEQPMSFGEVRGQDDISGFPSSVGPNMRVIVHFFNCLDVLEVSGTYIFV